MENTHLIPGSRRFYPQGCPDIRPPNLWIRRRGTRQKFLVKLFSKSFRERRLFEKRRHPKTFILFKNNPLTMPRKVLHVIPHMPQRITH
ncbi:hypothetical protein CFR76_11105 [Komagataeibacter swingsii]|uniref:Uncharacterized protein n=1 Tax=Komagataeibacter swingsii TaxID=215220 RepID=A0A2V4RKH2_9PROT|nr:hypothetical protein CFR76_11105 [Komagataeibacter swingsii]